MYYYCTISTQQIKSNLIFALAEKKEIYENITKNVSVPLYKYVVLN